MPDNKIMKTHEFNDSIIYRASCDCGSSECDLTLELEKDKDVEMLFLNLYKNLVWSSYWGSNDGWYVNLWRRIKCALTVLFTGYIKVEETFVFHDIEQIEHFINAINEGIEKLK
jgi:poly-D-alanine transfer protein DltD